MFLSTPNINEQTDVVQDNTKHALRLDEAVHVSFNNLKEAVLARRPILKEIWEKRGAKTLANYASDYLDVNQGTFTPERQAELITAISAEVGRTLSPDVAASVGAQLQKYFFVSSADHLGPICHPFFVNSNLMVSAAYPIKYDPVLQNIIVLSCSNISFNNSSFPRGLFFSAVSQSGNLGTHRLPFFPKNVGPQPVFNFKGFDVKSILNIKSTLEHLLHNGSINKTVYEKIMLLIAEIYDQEEIFGCSTFTDQVVKTNFKLWKKFFNGEKENFPNLVYIELEGLVAHLIKDHHLNKDTIVSKVLFDNSYRALAEKYFDNIMGGFTLSAKVGTYFFWALPPGQKFRQQLWLNGTYLETDDGSYRVEFTPEAINRALEAKEIFPNVLLIFITLAFYYGLKLLGGFNQTNLLSLMKDAFLKLCVEVGDVESATRIQNLQTKELNDAPTVAFARGPHNELVPASGLDLYLYSDERTAPSLRRTMNNLTLGDSLAPLMPELYRVIYREAERQPALAAITAEDITCLLGLDSKEEPCINIT